MQLASFFFPPSEINIFFIRGCWMEKLLRQQRHDYCLDAIFQYFSHDFLQYSLFSSICAVPNLSHEVKEEVIPLLMYTKQKTLSLSTSYRGHKIKYESKNSTLFRKEALKHSRVKTWETLLSYQVDIFSFALLAILKLWQNSVVIHKDLFVLQGFPNDDMNYSHSTKISYCKRQLLSKPLHWAKQASQNKHFDWIWHYHFLMRTPVLFLLADDCSLGADWLVNQTSQKMTN